MIFIALGVSFTISYILPQMHVLSLEGKTGAQ